MALIVAIADVFDALSVRRPYKEAWPIEQVIDTLKKDTGTHFDPMLVGLFIGIMPQILALRDDWAERERSGLARHV